MGMFDTIVFDRPIPCPKCGAEIRSNQSRGQGSTINRPARCGGHA
jgi:predicted RNA-binding Zn-ribbon protein involved in translation (DUF1610 family)